MEFETNGLSKQVNAVQKEIGAKKKVGLTELFPVQFAQIDDIQAKENADDLVAKKKELDAQVDASRKTVKEFETAMRQKASTVGNIVGKGVPVSLTEVRYYSFFWHNLSIQLYLG